MPNGVQPWNNVNNQFQLPSGGIGTPNQYQQFGPGVGGGGEPSSFEPLDIPPANMNDPFNDPQFGGQPQGSNPFGVPPINIPLVQPPGVNMPPNQQPMPRWMNFMPPIVRAGYGGYRLAQRLKEMYQNYQNNKQPGQPQPSGHPGQGGGGKPFDWGYFGQNPGDNPEFVKWQQPTGGGPLTAGPSQPGWVGGTPFGTSTANPGPNTGGGFNIPGGINWSPGAPGPVNLPSAVQWKMGTSSPAFQNWVQTHQLSPHFLATMQAAQGGGGKGGSAFNIHLSRPKSDN